MNFYRLPEVSVKTGLAPSTIYRDISRKTFPKPVKITPRLSVWRDTEIAAWAAARAAGKSEDEIKALVVRLEAERSELAA